MENATAPLVLVVEDDLDLAASMRQALEGAAYSVMTVSGIREAVFRLKNQKFSLIVMDLGLGEESGADLVDLIRSRKDLSNLDTPILVASGSVSKEAVQRLAGKIQHCMVKPFDLQNFIAQVQKLAK